jgi:TRAP-type C4-dicarboxylate transport system substrate-binding protein
MRKTLVLAVLTLFTTAARGDEPRQLRIGSAAPEGTGWARELHAFAHNIEAQSHGTLKVKLYLNSVAGDELEMGARTKKDQLDGVASGQMLCQEVAPSMRVLRLPGVFQSRDEARDVVTRLGPTLDAEARANGFMILGAAGLGPDVFFTREPARSLADLRRLKLWRWDVDTVGIVTSRDMGLSIVPTPLYDARRAYDAGALDGFMAAPSSALAFQWWTQARYVTDLHSAYLYGCFIMSEKAYQRLTAEQQDAVKAGTARMIFGFEELGRRQDEQLLGGLFAKQGMTMVPVSEQFRAEYFNAAKAARDHLGETMVPRALLERVLRLLADYRVEHQR